MSAAQGQPELLRRRKNRYENPDGIIEQYSSNRRRWPSIPAPGLDLCSTRFQQQTDRTWRFSRRIVFGAGTLSF
jgi:hypothetical protein